MGGNVCASYGSGTPKTPRQQPRKPDAKRGKELEWTFLRRYGSGQQARGQIRVTTYPEGRPNQNHNVVSTAASMRTATIETKARNKSQAWRGRGETRSLPVPRCSPAENGMASPGKVRRRISAPHYERETEERELSDRTQTAT